jgi:hypothetical protein
MRRGLVDDRRAVLSRCHALAVAAAASVTPAAAAAADGVLTPDELAKLQGCRPGLVAAISRAFRHLPIGGAAPPIGGGVAGPALVGPGRRGAVAAK